jgi:hypothetical protein
MLVKKQYQSFLLRMWQVKENDHTTRLFSLENSHIAERYGFADIDALCAFLQTLLDTEESTFEGIDDMESDVEGQFA